MFHWRGMEYLYPCTTYISCIPLPGSMNQWKTCALFLLLFFLEPGSEIIWSSICSIGVGEHWIPQVNAPIKTNWQAKKRKEKMVFSWFLTEFCPNVTRIGKIWGTVPPCPPPPPSHTPRPLFNCYTLYAYKLYLSLVHWFHPNNCLTEQTDRQNK